MEKRNKYNINHLIKIAKENRNDIFNKEISEDLNDATKFCLSFNIKEGGNKVFAGIIYQAYLTIARNAQSKEDFLNDFNELIEPNRGKSNKVYYSLNYKPAQLLNAAQNRKVKVNE